MAGRLAQEHSQPQPGGGVISIGTWLPDRRFGHALFEPAPDEGASAPPGLLVVVHGSERTHVDSLRDFVEFARSHRLVMLSPQFPPDVLGDGNPDGYKFLHEGDIRYDRLLDDMIDAVGARTGCRTARFCLHGYSGGAQFAHRYLMLHPGRILAASVGAPGEVTLADWDVDWWAGVRNTEAIFGRRVEPGMLHGLPVLLTVGEHDDDTEALKEQPPTRFWASDEERLGADRRRRLEALRTSLQELGAHVRLELLPAREHGSGPELAVPMAQSFFADALAQAEAAQAPAHRAKA
jgi:hypothetical protein